MVRQPIQPSSGEKAVKKTLLCMLTVALLYGVQLYAQVGGASTVVGGVTPTNQFNPTAVATTTTGSVTNPASNFVIQVLGGPIYFGGSVQTMAQVQLQLAASTTYLVVWNGFSEQAYAKTAVVGPGSPSTSSGASVNSPGVPSTLLFADPTKGEIALATVVCNATACGNGGNGSITDNRTAGNFPAGTPVQGIAFANLPATPDGELIMCVGCTQGAAGATCTSGAANVAAMRLGGVWRCFKTELDKAGNPY